LLSFVFNLVTA
jgi:hypothetical protein